MSFCCENLMEIFHEKLKWKDFFFFFCPVGTFDLSVFPVGSSGLLHYFLSFVIKARLLSGSVFGIRFGESGSNRSHQNRKHDGGEEQQDAAAHRLQDEVHPAGRPHLHRNLQGLRQTHEPHPVRLRRVPQDQAKELKAAGARGEAGSGSGSAAGGEPGFHDGGRPAPQRYWDRPGSPGGCGGRAGCGPRRGSGCPGRGADASGAGWTGGAGPRSGRAFPAGDDAAGQRHSCRGSSRRQHCRRPDAVPPRAGSPAPYGPSRAPSRYDGPASRHAAPYGPPDGNATRSGPRRPNGNAASRHEAATPWDERTAPSRDEAAAQAMKNLHPLRHLLYRCFLLLFNKVFSV